MVCTSLGSLLRPLFYFLCYIHFSLSVHALPIPAGDDHEEDINVDDLQLRLQPEEPRSSGGGAKVNASSNGFSNNLSRPNLTGGTHSLESVFGRSVGFRHPFYREKGGTLAVYMSLFSR